MAKEDTAAKTGDDDSVKLSKHDQIAKKPPPPPPAPVRADEKPEYYIAKGKAITSRRGILAEGDACQATDFLDGENTLNEMVRKGFVVSSARRDAGPPQ